MQAPSTAALLAGVTLLLLLPSAATAAYSSLWGRNGELWDPAGPLPDFSYAGGLIGGFVVSLNVHSAAWVMLSTAGPWPVQCTALVNGRGLSSPLCMSCMRPHMPAGYKQGNEPLPNPPVTRSVLKFKRPGMSDTQMFQAALAWAHKRSLTNSEAPALLAHPAVCCTPHCVGCQVQDAAAQSVTAHAIRPRPPALQSLLCCPSPPAASP